MIGPRSNASRQAIALEFQNHRRDVRPPCSSAISSIQCPRDPGPLRVRSRGTNPQSMSIHIFNQHLAHPPRFIGGRFGNLHRLSQVLLIQGIQVFQCGEIKVHPHAGTALHLLGQRHTEVTPAYLRKRRERLSAWPTKHLPETQRGAVVVKARGHVFDVQNRIPPVNTTRVILVSMPTSSFKLRGMVRASGNAAVPLLMKSETPSVSQ